MSDSRMVDESAARGKDRVKDVAAAAGVSARPAPSSGGGFALSRLNIFLVVLLAVVALLGAVSHVDYSQPNIEILPDMKYSLAWTAYAENPNFRNGRTLQAPVPGTIPRGDSPLHYEATKEDAARAGEELENPYDVDAAVPEPDAAADSPENENAPQTEGAPENENVDSAAQPAPSPPSREDRLRDSVQRGEEVYRAICISCHGPTGAGDGPVAKRGFPPPPSLLTGKSREVKDGQLFHILTYGQGNMSSVATQLDRAERWDVINYVRDMQQSAPVEMPPAEAEDPPPEPESKEQDSVD